MLKDVGLITCCHVLGTKTQAFRCSKPDKKHAITVIKKDEHIDVAILKMEGIDLSNECYLSAESSDEVKTEDQVKVFGFPDYGFYAPPSITNAKVTSIRPISGVKIIFLDTTIHGGNSGGPVLNNKNELIGIVTKGKKEEVQSQAVHIDTIKTFLTSC